MNSKNTIKMQGRIRGGNKGITYMSNRQILAIANSKVILTIVRLWKTEIVEAGCNMIHSNTIS